jgi:S-adenosylmethionine synthetase
MITQDPTARVAVETMITTGLVHVAGEVSTEGYVEIPSLVRETILGIGYNSSRIGFDGESCGVSVSIGQQSPDIAQGVDAGLETRGKVSSDRLETQGAGDQGIMFGYASNETPTYMPTAISLAHKLSDKHQ